VCGARQGFERYRSVARIEKPIQRRAAGVHEASGVDHEAASKGRLPPKMAAPPGL
jgi:hypothetical protein